MRALNAAPVAADDLARAVQDFQRTRAEVSAEGISWLCAVQQLEFLVRQYPERARAVLADIDRERCARAHAAVFLARPLSGSSVGA